MVEELALLIPVIALSIPIIAILSSTYRKTHSGDNPELKRRIEMLEERISELQKTNNNLGDSINQLEEKQNFLTRLIEDKS